MSGPWMTVGAWVCHTAAGGGLLLLLAWVLMRRTRQPARQQRLGECGLAAALLLAVLGVAPAWLTVAVPVAGPALPAAPREAAPAEVDRGPAVAEPRAPWGPENLPWGDGPGSGAPALVPPRLVTTPSAPAPVPAPVPAPAAAATAAVVPAAPRLDQPRPPSLAATALAALGLAYALAASFLAGRWVLGHLALWRLLATAQPAPEPVARLFAARTTGRRPARLLVSRRLRVPVSCGLFCPTVVLPAALCDDPVPLRWVFAHELTHLERRDPWTCALFGLGQVIYFYLPWFWWARRQVALCQEFLADAAVAEGEEAPEEYAQFLLGLTPAPAIPAGAASVAGRPSDLRRRLVMLLHAPRALERRCPWPWSWTTAAGLTVVAVAVAGIRLEATPAALPRATPAAVALAAAEAPPETPHREARPATELVGIVQPRPVELPEPTPPRKDLPAPPPPRATEPAPPAAAPVIEGASAAPLVLAPGPAPWPDAGRLGVRVAPPDAVLVDQLDLPRGQGLVLEEVLAGSQAARAGLRPHDVLLLLDGKPVPGEPWRFAQLLGAIPGAKAVTAGVVRRGKRETVHELVLADTWPRAWPSPRTPPVPGILPEWPAGDPRSPASARAATSVLRTPNRFAARDEEGALVLQVTGTTAGAGWRVEQVVLQVGGRVATYTRLEDVPPAYRERVARLVAVSAAAGSRVEIHPAR